MLTELRHIVNNNDMKVPRISTLNFIRTNQCRGVSGVLVNPLTFVDHRHIVSQWLSNSCLVSKSFLKHSVNCLDVNLFSIDNYAELKEFLICHIDEVSLG